jgi:hypothetical protein
MEVFGLPLHSSKWTLLASLLFCAACAPCPAQASGSFNVDEGATRLSFPGDHFHLELVVTNGNPSVSAQVSAELLDTDDTVRSSASATCELAAGTTVCQVEMPSATSHSKHGASDGDWLPLFRLSYTVATAGALPISGTIALDRIAPDLFELHVAAPKNIHLGGTYTARIRALHPLTHKPQADVPLDITLTADYAEDDKDNEDFGQLHVRTDVDGFASAPFTVPNDADLTSVDLNVTGGLANLHPSTTQSLSIPENARFDLTTDKPLYQPGQTVHSRILLLDRSGHVSTQKNVRVDISDPDDTLVFRAEALTSKYGIATVDWAVPARLRLGEYTLNATLPDDPNTHQTASATLRLSRYDLPTFVVSPIPDRPFYVPGNDAVVDIRANYLFGKPVLHGHVRVVREDDRTWNFAEQRYDVKEGKTVSGELDADGSFRPRIPLTADLAEYRHGDPSNEFEDLHLAAYVTDASTGRTEQRRFDLRVTGQALHVYVTFGDQTKGMPEQLYLAANTADGTPAECDLDLSLLPYGAPDDKLRQRIARALPLQKIYTDTHGLARVSLPAYEELLRAAFAGQRSASNAPEEQPTLYITARDKDGHIGAITQDLIPPTGTFRITTQKTIYQPGDSIDVQIDSAESSLPLTVQIFRHTFHGDLTLAARDIALVNGHASLSVTSDQRYSGFVFIAVIALGANLREAQKYSGYYGSGDPQSRVASHALLFPHDNSLRVGIKMSADTFAPGDQATATFDVRGPQDLDGDEAAQAPSALGIVAVDQAVEERNRADNDFGGTDTQSFFFRWRSDFEDNGTAGGFTLKTLERLDATQPLPPDAQLAAEVLLAGQHLSLDTTRDEAGQDLESVFLPIIEPQIASARKALEQYLVVHTELPVTMPELAALLATKDIDLLALRDPWGTPYSVHATADNNGVFTLTLHSNGPDKSHSTEDDFEVPFASWRWFAGHQLELKNAVAAFHKRTGRFIRNLTELRSEMQAEGIRLNDWRDPWGQPFSFQFSIAQTQFVIHARSAGDPSYKPRYDFERGPYLVGSAEIDYTVELRKHIETALGRYAASHLYPTNDAQFTAALRLSGIVPSQLIDPWQHPLYATFRSHSFFTDRVRTEAHATAGSVPQNRTIITPVTAISDIVELHSLGPDGRRNTPDDFIFATFSRVRSLQSAQDSVPKHAPHQTAHSGQTGDIAGTISDQTGAVIPNVVIVAINQNTGMEFEEKSDSDGAYLMGPLPAGIYKVRFRARGFMDLVYDQVSILPLNTVTLDAKLNVGSVTEAVEVNASPMMLNTESASISSQPLNGRNLISLMKIAPGIAGGGGGGAVSTPRLRDYFPETLLWRPEVITAPDGTATLRFPVADSITTWQLSAAASTLLGNTGSGTAQFRSFQPFFAAFDPPSILTIGDSIALPVTLRNYLDHPVVVRSSLNAAPWFRLDGSASSTTQVASQESASPVFRFTALASISEAQQQFIAQAGETGDRISRPVTVHPNGEETAVTTAAILSPGDNILNHNLPADTLPGSSETTLKLYPNLGAHIRDALEKMANYPNGCAEQIISIAWASLVLQRYSASIPQRDEKLQQQTHLNLQEAYENLLANQLPSGGFAYWPKDRNADLALTAYAIQFLAEARNFITIDDGVLSKAVEFLAKQQQPKSNAAAGLWVRVDRDRKPHPEDARGNAMLTASIAAMIAGAPNTDWILKKAVAAIQPFAEQFDEPYTLASYALATLALKDTVRSETAIKRLRATAHSENGGAYWALETNTPFFGWGRAGRVEATAQVLRALLTAGAQPQDDLVARGLLFLNHEQDRQSLWYSTQATARVLDVLAEIALRSRATAFSGDPGSLSVKVDDQPSIAVPLPPAVKDAGPIFIPLGGALAAGSHRVALNLPASAQSASAQLVSSLYRPWPSVAPASSVTNNEQLRMTVAFGTTEPLPGKPVNVTTHIERIGFEGYGMMIAEIGLPPGADVDRASLESAVSSSDYELNHYEVLPDKVLIYLWPKAGGLTLHFRFTLRYALDALSAPSAVYDYYNPDARFDLSPTRFKTQ